MGIPQAVYETGMRHDIFTIPCLGRLKSYYELTIQGPKLSFKLGGFKIAARRRQMTRLG